MIDLAKKIRRRVLYFFLYDLKFYKAHKSKNTVFVCVESAVHNNMGDQALGFCRKEFLQKVGISNSQIIDISSRDRMKFWNYINHSISDFDVILLRGGGFFGSLWEDGFSIILQFIEYFPNNRIILFPQSVWFDDSTNGKKLLKKSMDIINNRKNIYLFARDFNSYKLFKKFYPKTNIYVTPDTVLSYRPSFSVNKNNSILVCLRSDKERKMIDEEKEELFKTIEKQNMQIIEQDTCIQYHFKNINDRQKKLYELWEKFASSRVVITDRLHGMIFSVITGTPCIVFDNVDHKIKNAYEWIKELEYVRFLDNVQDIEQNVKELLNLNNISYPSEMMFEKFEPLISLIRNFNNE